MTAKTCRVCSKFKPLSEFYVRAGSKDGHRSECSECTITRARRSASGRRSQLAAYNREYRERHMERLRDVRRAWDARVDRRRYYRQYRATNLGRLLDNERRYRGRHPEVQAARRLERRAVAMDATAREFVRMLLADPCSYCGGRGGTIDHLDPITQSGTNHYENLTAACLSCNSQKRCKSVLLFLAGRLRDRCVASLAEVA